MELLKWIKESAVNFLNVHSVKKVPGIDHSKSPLKEIVKNLFSASKDPLGKDATNPVPNTD